MTAPSTARSPRSAIIRGLSAAIGVGAYFLALQGRPAPLTRVLAAMGGVYAGAALPAALWALAGLALGRTFGLRLSAVVIGAGPVWRTSVRERRTMVLLRIPLPLVRFRMTPVPGSSAVRPVALLLAALTLQVLTGAALLSVSAPFTVAAGAACLGFAVLRLSGGGAFRAAAQAAAAERPASAEETPARVLVAVQRSVREARALLDAAPPRGEQASAAERMAEAVVLLAEGRYRETADLAEALEKALDTSGPELVAARLYRARALAYAMEAGPAEPGDAETFAALCGQLRDAPALLVSGTDLRSLYSLANGDVERAIDEARAAARVGSAPVRRCMAYCTLAMALHRAGRGDAALKALHRAQQAGPDLARIAFVEGVLRDAGSPVPSHS